MIRAKFSPTHLARLAPGVFFALASTLCWADTFQCKGDIYRVKLNDDLLKEQSLADQAVLTVYERNIGKIASLNRKEIVKSISQRIVSYEGQTHAHNHGRFIAVKLSLKKEPEQSISERGRYLAQIKINADGHKSKGFLICSRH